MGNTGPIFHTNYPTTKRKSINTRKKHYLPLVNVTSDTPCRVHVTRLWKRWIGDAICMQSTIITKLFAKLFSGGIRSFDSEDIEFDGEDIESGWNLGLVVGKFRFFGKARVVCMFDLNWSFTFFDLCGWMFDIRW